MENTLENKVIFLNQYLGQNVILYDVKRPVKLIGSMYNVVYLEYKREIKYVAVENVVAELTPLSMISDEDAIECANILIDKGDSIRDKEDAKKHYWRGLILSLRESSDVFLSNTHIYQYLQSKDYALPYLGVSVEEQISRNWIKLRTEKQQ